MRNNSTPPISLKFLIFLFGIVTIMFFYATTPNEVNNINNKKQSFEEMLEYNNISPKKDEDIYEDSILSSETQIKNTNIEQQDILSAYIPPEYNRPVNSTNKNINTQEKYNELLDELKILQPKSINSVATAVNKILEYKGYPSNLVKITTDMNKSNLNIQGSYLIAQFEFPTGEMKISREQIYNLDMKLIISIVAHELDHFEKIAQICKYMGMTEFKKMLSENGVGYIDEIFWEKASRYADVTNFNAETYKKALVRYLSQNKIELTSSYSDFYRLTENIRNPLEISAYEVSDYIQKYYGIPLSEGPMKSITRKFNEVDWAIYNIINKNEIIQNERIPLFDYFFSKAIINIFPNFKTEFENCIENKEGDLTQFWLNYERILSNFYIKGQIDSNSLNIILKLLTETKKEAQKGLSHEQIADALKYKVRTILSNIVYPNAISNIRKTATAYLKYIELENIEDAKTELDFIITLICIENIMIFYYYCFYKIHFLYILT